MLTGAAGIKKKEAVATLAQFAKSDFLPHIRTHFAEKRATLAYYEIQVSHLTGYAPLANAALDAVTQEIITGVRDEVAKG